MPSLSIAQTIRAVQPDVVVVELCQYRVSMLKMDENTLLREAKDINMEKVQQAIKQVRLWGYGNYQRGKEKKQGELMEGKKIIAKQRQ